MCVNNGVALAWNSPPGQCLPHHIDGKTKPEAHFKTIPLCDEHHSRYKKTGLHYNLTRWEERHGSQYELLEQVKGLVDAGNPWLI